MEREEMNHLKKRLLMIIGFISFIVLLYLFRPEWFQHVISMFDTGAMDVFVKYIQSFGLWAPVISILLMIAQALAAPLPAFLIAGANGIVFGVGWGILISWLGGMVGAMVSFWLARWLGREFVDRITRGKASLEKVNAMSSKHGFKMIFVTRLLPFISFDIISYLAGLSRMKMGSFLLATGLGMIPGTVLYTALGHDLLQAETYSKRLLMVIGLIGILYAVGKFIGWRKRGYYSFRRRSKP
jgi:uncharacterized membrane protein YdjX (TVP38/TMEM64 family)